MIHGPSSFFGLLPSRLTIVQGVFSCSRWANVQDEIPLALIDDYRNVRAAEPVVRHCAVRAYGVGSSKFEGPNIRARHSSEEFSRETAISVKDEAGDRGEPCSGSVETTTTPRWISCRFGVLDSSVRQQLTRSDCTPSTL